MSIYERNMATDLEQIDNLRGNSIYPNHRHYKASKSKDLENIEVNKHSNKYPKFRMEFEENAIQQS